MPYFFYILRCVDDSLYAGIAINLEKRLEAHNSGRGSKYVRSRGGGRLVYKQTLPDRSAALKRETEIKKLSKSAKEKMIEEYQSGPKAQT